MRGFGAEYRMGLLSLIRGRLICDFALWLPTLNSCDTPRIILGRLAGAIGISGFKLVERQADE